MRDLRGYLAAAARAGWLRRVRRPVSPRHEIAAVTAKFDGAEALLFERVRGTRFRVVSNLVGTRERFAAAVGAGRAGPHERIAAAAASPRRPRRAARGLFMQNAARGLSALPVATHFEKEPGPFVASAVVYARNPETGEQNASFHRMMPAGPRSLTVRMVEGRHLHRCYEEAASRGEDLQVAAAVGVHPAVLAAAAYRAPWGEDEAGVANALLGGGLAVAPCPRTGLLVPAGAELVMEGRVRRDLRREEWMVEMLRTYDAPRSQPVLELDGIYHRDSPIYHDVLPGYAEHRLLMGMPAEAALQAGMRASFPEAGAAALTAGGCNWLHAVVQARSPVSPRRARAMIRRAFEIHRSLKHVTVVDSDIDPSSAEQVEYAMATRFQADRDLVVVRGARGSSLDPSSDQASLRTAKTGADATRPAGRRPEGFELARIRGASRVPESPRRS